jgi:hypothetical protein
VTNGRTQNWCCLLSNLLDILRLYWRSSGVWATKEPLDLQYNLEWYDLHRRSLWRRHCHVMTQSYLLLTSKMSHPKWAPNVCSVHTKEHNLRNKSEFSNEKSNYYLWTNVQFYEPFSFAGQFFKIIICKFEHWCIGSGSIYNWNSTTNKQKWNQKNTTRHHGRSELYKKNNKIKKSKLSPSVEIERRLYLVL